MENSTLLITYLIVKDYALESNGGQVISTPATTPYSPFNIEGLLGFLHTYTLPSNPQTLLQPSHFPGDCFAFAGSHGRIRIQLATSVAITAVTVEHVDRRLVLDRSSAPKHFEILVSTYLSIVKILDFIELNSIFEEKMGVNLVF